MKNLILVSLDTVRADVAYSGKFETIEKLREHSITLGKAAELAEISIWEMLDIVKEKKIDWVGLTPEIIDRDFERAMKLSKKIKIK